MLSIYPITKLPIYPILLEYRETRQSRVFFIFKELLGDLAPWGAVEL
jgi:hypothetical protein